MKKVAIWGLSVVGEAVYKYIYNSKEYEIVTVADRDKNIKLKHGTDWRCVSPKVW